MVKQLDRTNEDERELEFFSQPSALAIDEMFEHTDKKALGILWYPKTNEFMFNADHIIA
jgi:hypothetical protein